MKVHHSSELVALVARAKQGNADNHKLVNDIKAKNISAVQTLLDCLQFTQDHPDATVDDVGKRLATACEIANATFTQIGVLIDRLTQIEQAGIESLELASRILGDDPPVGQAMH